MVIIKRNLLCDGGKYDLAALHYITDVYRIQLHLGRIVSGIWVPHAVLTHVFPSIPASREESDTILVKPFYVGTCVQLGIIPDFYINQSAGYGDCLKAELTKSFKEYASMFLRVVLSDPFDPNSYDG